MPPGERRPVRSCLACGRTAPQAELVRLALKDGQVVMDRDRRLPGRGAYLCPGKPCLDKLREDKKRDRAFRKKLGESAWSRLLGGDQAQG